MLLIDLDPQGNASKGLGISVSCDDITIRDIMSKVINKDMNFDNTFGVVKNDEGVFLVPSNPLFAEMDIRFNSLALGRERILKRYIDKIKDDYDVIVIDCAPALNTTTMNALVAATNVIIPTCIGETDIDKTYTMPKSYVNCRKPRNISEAKRKQAREQMKKINNAEK